MVDGVFLFATNLIKLITRSTELVRLSLCMLTNVWFLTDRANDSSQGWSGLKIFGYILLALVVVAGVIGVVVYVKSQESSRKRFY